MSMTQFVQYIFSGITSGGIYALVGIGFVLVYRMSHIVNLAQGHFYVLGAYLAFTLIDSNGVSRIIAIPLVILTVCLIVVLLQRLTLHPIRERDVLSKVILTIGWVFIIDGVIDWIYGPEGRSLSPFPGPRSLEIAGATISFQSIWVLAATILGTVGLALFLTRTTIGKALEACSENQVGAKLVGINVERMLLITFIGSAAFGTVAGIVAAPVTYVSYTVGLGLTIKGLTAAIIGGLNNVYGALVGGVLLGLLEAFSAGLISTLFYELISIIALLIILVARPQGILGGTR